MDNPVEIARNIALLNQKIKRIQEELEDAHEVREYLIERLGETHTTELTT